MCCQLCEDVSAFPCVFTHLSFIFPLYLKVQRVSPNGCVLGRWKTFAPVGHRSKHQMILNVFQINSLKSILFIYLLLPLSSHPSSSDHKLSSSVPLPPTPSCSAPACSCLVAVVVLVLLSATV